MTNRLPSREKTEHVRSITLRISTCVSSSAFESESILGRVRSFGDPKYEREKRLKPSSGMKYSRSHEV